MVNFNRTSDLVHRTWLAMRMGDLWKLLDLVRKEDTLVFGVHNACMKLSLTVL